MWKKTKYISTRASLNVSIRANFFKSQFNFTSCFKNSKFFPFSDWNGFLSVYFTDKPRDEKIDNCLHSKLEIKTPIWIGTSVLYSKLGKRSHHDWTVHTWSIGIFTNPIRIKKKCFVADIILLRAVSNEGIDCMRSIFYTKPASYCQSVNAVHHAQLIQNDKKNYLCVKEYEK